MTGVYIATEDALSEAVAERLILEENNGLYVGVRVGLKGNTFLRMKLQQFKEIARSIPVFILTDLDLVECPACLIEEWSGKGELPSKMLLRVAVRETEAWLLADREGFADFSGVPLHRIPEQPETLVNPKETLLNIVRRYGKRAVKAGILPERGSTARIGLSYNQVLCEFVKDSWSPDRASMFAKSLHRTRYRLHELRLSLNSKEDSGVKPRKGSN
jgi:hypothetical protein